MLAFDGCVRLSSAKFDGDYPYIGLNAFQDCAPGFTIYYNASASGWDNPWIVDWISYGGMVKINRKG